ncbi:enolase C-terminal domain-like protein [Azohydromonas australica]|uniref:enolase C-terminal domain-like protein n=1 Tax=Azohydromonas australica TaxID=364039 RepID=UPI000425FDBD|nr:enolase C-terminal domain-like protein [Azohydromonas australica]
MSEPLLITAVKARGVNVPLEFPVKTSVGIVATAPLVLIDMETSGGLVGRSYVFTYTPLALESTRQMVLALGSAIERQPVSPFDLDALLASRLRLLGRSGIALMACAGIDMAAWDALAVQHGKPLVELLGGRRRPVPAYDSHSMDGVELGVRRAEGARDAGFKAIKTKIGYATLEEDLRVIRALRRAAGEGVQLMVDYNQSLTIPEARRRIHALQGEGVAWVEEPTLQEDWAGHAVLRGASTLPIQMGENWCGPDEMAKALKAGACDLAMPDAMKIGGVTGWLRAAALAQAHGVPMSSHIFQEVSVHLLGVTPTAHWLERMDLAAPILREPLAFKDGSAIAPDVPGTGIDWDEAAVARYAA